MCNCNKKRQAYSNENVQQKGKSKVQYLGENTFSINGNYTGRLYRFSAKKNILQVDSRDAEDLREEEELQVIS